VDRDNFEWPYLRNSSKMATCRQHEIGVTGNSAIRSADPENPTLEPNMKRIGSPVAEILSFEIFQNLGFEATIRNSAILSADPENDTIRYDRRV